MGQRGVVGADLEVLSFKQHTVNKIHYKSIAKLLRIQESPVMLMMILMFPLVISPIYHFKQFVAL